MITLYKDSFIEILGITEPEAGCGLACLDCGRIALLF